MLGYSIHRQPEVVSLPGREADGSDLELFESLAKRRKADDKFFEALTKGFQSFAQSMEEQEFDVLSIEGKDIKKFGRVVQVGKGDHHNGSYTERQNVEYSLVEYDWKELPYVLIEGAKIKDAPLDKYCSFEGGSPIEGIARLKFGDVRAAQDAKKIFRQYLNVFMKNTVTEDPVPELSMVGASPCIPAAVMGVPYHMYHNEHDVGLGHINLMMDIGAVADIEPSDMARRGICISALAYAIQSIRPVTVWAVTGRFNTFMCFTRVKVGTSPIDISRLCAAFANPIFTRFAMNYDPVPHFKSLWYNMGPSINYHKVCGLGPNDVFVPRCPSDYGLVEGMLADMPGWLKANMKFGSEQIQGFFNNMLGAP